MSSVWGVDLPGGARLRPSQPHYAQETEKARRRDRYGTRAGVRLRQRL